MNSEERQQQLTTALAQVTLPLGIAIRPGYPDQHERQGQLL
ncbi:MAG TPA: hypothetical protein VEU97_09945 [Ktedonobacteraceae bacterium]|nr:hypothetical protein [Ktedonobacteraceae bacterium]